LTKILYQYRILTGYSEMENLTEKELDETISPITSLIGKSEKSQQKLKPETWQYKMLQKNIKALYISKKLINKEIIDINNYTREELQEAILALSSMIKRTENAKIKFSAGTSQYTLQQNRYKALCFALELVKKFLQKQNNVKE
jgi:hypothetical protein